MTLWDEIRTVAVILIMLLLPGWALLSIGQYWKRWQPLQRWFLALCLGIAVYPVMFYVARVVFPSLHIGLNKLILFLVMCALIVFWRYRHDWKDQFKLGKQDAWVLLILVVTMATRLILAHQYPYPAWTDSLHHSIITKLVMLNGQLPYTMLPFDLGSLSGYHLGLYTLTGSTGLLAAIPPHSALLWTCQVINGFAGVVIFLILDKKVSRIAALAGMIFAGLLSFQPAWYFNWGRDTQLAAQTILLPAALVFWELLESVVSPARDKPGNNFSVVFLTALLLVGCAIIHFRVAAFLLPLVIFKSVLTLVRKGQVSAERWKLARTILLTGLLSLILILPAFLPAINNYVDPPSITTANPDLPKPPGTLTEDPYYRFSGKQLFGLGLNKTLSLLALSGLIIGLTDRRTKVFSLLIIFWVLVLTVEGYLYLLNIRKLAFINMAGIMILAYLPGALGFGLLIEKLYKTMEHLLGSKAENALMAVILLVGIIFAPDRVKGIETYRQYMTSQDETAMVWMKSNIPKEAIIGINTAYWTKTAFIGTDAGYWIPYFAELETSTRTMMSYDSPDFQLVGTRTKNIVDLYANPKSLPSLCEQGIDYLYSAKKPPYNKKDFEIDKMVLQAGTRLIYDRGGVQILKICE